LAIQAGGASASAETATGAVSSRSEEANKLGAASVGSLAGSGALEAVEHERPALLFAYRPIAHMAMQGRAPSSSGAIPPPPASSS
jgi:hypothetical protein